MEEFFGYKKVAKGQKQALVFDVFKNVAPKYDVMNDVMSFGLHRLWKKQFIDGVFMHNQAKLLDLAGGTGDISFALHNKAQQQGINIDITLSDINPNMLREAKNRAIDKNLLNITFQEINAEAIPLEDNSCDAVTISFGIRNVSDIKKVLSEINRVLKPLGSFHCLEFTPPMGDNLFSKIYDAYSFNAIPKIGGLITGDKASYEYLVESIRKFPPICEFSQMMTEAGFCNIQARKLAPPIVAIHRGWKF